MLKCTPNSSSFHPMLLALVKRPFHSTYNGLLHSPVSNFSLYHTTTSISTMENPRRTYVDALALLDTLQSNRAIGNSILQSHGAMNLDAIPEMLNWVDKAGYRVDDFNKLRVIHVGGTKGKGSVCALVASILQQYSNASHMTQATAKGLGKVGLYTSPHLVTVRERIRINNKPISQSLFASHFFTLWDRFSASASAAGLPNPSGPETRPGYFRYLTIMALH